MAATDIFNWNSWLNDSMELMKKQTKRCSRRRNRQLYSKLRNSATLDKRGSKLAHRQRLWSKPTRILSNRKNTPKKPSEKINNQWKTEYDIWNMMTQTIEQHLVGNLKINWNNNEIGVRDSTNNIRLIKNRQELNQLILVNSNGQKTNVNNLMNPNDSNSDVSLKIEFSLIPVINGFTVVQEAELQSHAVNVNAKEINNNDIECLDDEVDSECELERTLTSDDEVHDSTFENTMSTFDTTITNESFVCDYEEFLIDLDPKTSSTLISDKENIPVFSTPTR